MKTSVLREEVIHELHTLPADRLREVYDFVGFLQSKRAPSIPEQLDPPSDPILHLVGAIEVEPFAYRIDEDPYRS